MSIKFAEYTMHLRPKSPPSSREALVVFGRLFARRAVAANQSHDRYEANAECDLWRRQRK